MSSTLTRANKGQVKLSQQAIEKRLKNKDWFHVFSEDGEVKLNVHVARLPAPDRSMVADWAGAASAGTSIAMVFGQAPPGVKKMTGALIVQMSNKRAREILLAPQFLTAVYDYAAKEGIKPQVHEPDAEFYPMERIVTERAQLVGVALGEDEAELRFYRASRSDFNAAAQDLQVDLIYPVIEVRMSAEQLVHFIKTLEVVSAPAPAERSRP